MSAFGTIISTSEVKDTASQTPADAATINVTVVAGKNTVVRWTTTQNTTVNISAGTPSIGDRLTMIVINDGILPRVITWGTLLTSIGVATGVISKTSIVEFVGNGANFVESNRTVGI